LSHRPDGVSLTGEGASGVVSVESNVRAGVELMGYRLESIIGLGGMGVVYRALDLRLKRSVALKLMAPDLALDERFRARFTRESELAMSLEHPNVIPIHDAGEVDGRLFLAMRLVEDGTLRTLLREQGSLAPARLIAIARQVANALDAAHAKGLVHRDVKPSNVLLDASEHVYLADFGLTRRLDEQAGRIGDDRSLGTPAYLAPEQIEGGPVDGRADVYSLGCVLYEGLTGEPPFARDSRLAVVWAHLEEEAPAASERRPDLPGAVDQVLATAMAKEPADRYPSCAALVEAAEDSLGLTAQAAPWRRFGVVAAVALVVAVAAMVAAVLTRGGDEAAGSAAAAVKADTLVRYDPETTAIEAVIEVGRGPYAAVISGERVWVYNNTDHSVSEVDAVEEEVLHTTEIETIPDDVTPISGPVLAADASGAWVVGYDYTRSRGAVTQVLPDGAGTREYSIAGHPKGIAVAEGAIWVIVTGLPGSAVLRLDPRTGDVARQTRLNSNPDAAGGGLAVGGGAVWAMDAGIATLYRVDLESGAVRSRDLGEVAAPPVAGFGSIWVCAANPGSSMLRIDPATFRTTFAINSIPAEDGRFAVGLGGLWRHDVPSGNVMRFNTTTGRVVRTIRVTPAPPDARDEVVIAPTAVVAGAGGLWVTVG
jgi:Protein kinase domain